MATRPIENYLIDMDGVLVREEVAIPGADRFIRALQDAGRPYLLLTNNSVYTPRDLAVCDGHIVKARVLFHLRDDSCACR